MRPRSSLAQLFGPVSAENVDPAFYRFSGKVRLIALGILFAINLLGSIHPQDAGFDPAQWNFYMWLNSPLLLVDMLCGLLLWKGRGTTRRLRHLTMACLVVEAFSTLLLIQRSGSLTSHMIVFSMVLVLVYRAYFDYAVGLLAFLSLFVGHWLIVIMEAAGLLPSAPMYIAAPSPIYQQATGQLGAMLVVSVSMILAFIATNTLVNKLRNKEAAIRILRANLAAAQPGRAGRYTGKTLNNTYVLGNLLGSGGMGEVYRGLHERTKRPLAIKVLHPHLLDDPMLLKRFQREAEITGTLGSEHIVEIVDIDQDGDLPYIVLELLEGESLGDLITRLGALPLDQVERIVVQVATGLEVAHKAGIVHRDLKPENLFLCHRGDEVVVKLLDFGVSKIQGQATALTQEMALLGTPDFMSPEQTLGLVEDVDARTDVFALGAICYTAISGRRPFSASSVPALLRRICDEEPVPLQTLVPEVCVEIASVLSIAMAKRFEERYASAAEFRDDFVAAQQGSLAAPVLARAAALHRGKPNSADFSQAAASRAMGSAEANMGHDDTAAAGPAEPAIAHADTGAPDSNIGHDKTAAASSEHSGPSRA